MNAFDLQRNSTMEFENTYFWTATIHDWNRLLMLDTFKDVVIDSLIYLSRLELIDVFGFVIMPNHIHLIWRMNKMNGKENPKSSLLKHTAHQFMKMVTVEQLITYRVGVANKQHEFWQRDSLAIELYTPDVAYQKLDYIHLNPMAKDWNLVTDPCDYKYSSALFYEKEDHRFEFLRHIGEEF
jgi:REP element-mobilizing transposase RayT